MSIPEACIRAARTGVTLDTEARARRVILALAENIPEDAVAAAAHAVFAEPCQIDYELMQEGLTAFLNHVAGETP